MEYYLAVRINMIIWVNCNIKQKKPDTRFTYYVTHLYLKFRHKYTVLKIRSWLSCEGNSDWEGEGVFWNWVNSISSSGRTSHNLVTLWKFTALCPDDLSPFLNVCPTSITGSKNKTSEKIQMQAKYTSQKNKGFAKFSAHWPCRK